MENNENNPDLSIQWKNGTKVKIRPRRYQITKKQLQAIMENKLDGILNESMKFDTDEQKRDFIKSGNIITFKKALPNFPNKQIAISKIKREKSGAIKLINPFGTESPWFKSEQELIDGIDWEWMANNIITKEYE